MNLLLRQQKLQIFYVPHTNKLHQIHKSYKGYYIPSIAQKMKFSIIGASAIRFRHA